MNCEYCGEEDAMLEAEFDMKSTWNSLGTPILHFCADTE